MEKIIMLNVGTDNIDSRIEGETFQKMMDICFAKATSFSLSKHVYPETTCNTETLLKPYIIKELTVNDWFGYAGMEKPFRVFLYEANETTKKIIKNHYTEIFVSKLINDYPRKGASGLELHDAIVLEDLCFFHKKKMFLGTISHESICVVNLFDKAFAQEVLPLTRWVTDSNATFGILREYL